MDHKVKFGIPDKVVPLREISIGEESEDDSVVRTDLIDLQNDEFIQRPPKETVKFQPLEEEGERYLLEYMRLPPIDLSATPSRVYINPHPTPSIMSSGANSANEWWTRVDYEEEEVGELECGGTTLRLGKRAVKRKESEEGEPVEAGAKTFPKTLEMQRERRMREMREEEATRAEVIARLEKQMVSLFNIKRQYRKTVGKEGCAARKSALPPVVGVTADDKLAWQRDSLLAKIKWKKLEDERKRKKAIERRIMIVQSILNEQKYKERELKRRIREETRLTKTKRKKDKGDLKTISFDELQGISHESVKTDSIEIAEEIVDDGLEPDIAEQPEPPPSPENMEDLQPPEQSPKKPSKGKKDKKEKKEKKEKKKSSDVGKKKEKKKKISKEVEEAPAICEPEPELPASQLAELTLWFDDLRGKILGQTAGDRQLSEETEVELKPREVVFEDVSPGRRFQRTVTVTNKGGDPLQCRVAAVHQPPLAVIQATLSGPSKARPGQSWTLTVTLDPQGCVEDSEAEVELQCCRGEVRSRVTVVVRLMRPRAKPSLITPAIRFGSQVYWSDGTSKVLRITNPGGAGCVVTWTEVPEKVSELSGAGDNCMLEERTFSEDQGLPASKQIARQILRTVFKNVFKKFRIESRQPVVLPARSQVTLGVRFRPALTLDRGDVGTKFRLHFEGENGETDSQDVVVSGFIERSPFRLELEVINMKLCYAGGLVQQARLVVTSSAGHACQVAARVPRSMAGMVAVVPRTAVVAANSHVTLAVRLVLRSDFLDRPCRYLDTSCGLLMFPVTVWVTDPGTPGAPPLEATVVASIAPPCPLTVAPPALDLGSVTTLETVEAELRVTNHSTRSYTFAFLNLPSNVMIEPGGGCGSILPHETVKLKLLFSPRARDLGIDCERPGGEGEVNLTLRCYTSVSYASPARGQESLIDKSGVSSQYTVASGPSFKKTGSYEQSSIEEKNKTKRKVTFLDEGSVHTVSGGSFLPTGDTDVHDNVRDSDGNAVEEEKDMGNEEDTTVENEEGNTTEEGNEDGLEYNSDNGMEDGVENTEEDEYEESITISEIKEESNELPDEELWEFYSKFQFEKCRKTEKRKEAKKKLKKQSFADNEDELFSNVISEENSNVNEDKGSDLDMKVESNEESQHGEEIQSSEKENESIAEKLEGNSDQDHNVSESDENYFNVDEGESSDKSEAGSEKEEENESRESGEVCQLPDVSQRFATLSVRAYVTDPLVELTAQTVVLPPTPCSGYSVARLYLRNRPQKSCSVHEKITKFKIRFEFRSPSKNLTVEPKQGYITYKQNQKISLIYSPKLSENVIAEKALETKAENLKFQKMQDLLNEYNKLMEGKQAKGKGKGGDKKEEDEITAENDEKSNKGKGKKSKASVVSVKTKKESLKKGKAPKEKASGPLPDVVVDPKDVVVAEEDLKNAEMTMLKYLEPYKETMTISCLLETILENGNKRREKLMCDVICPVVAPAIFLNSPPCLDFGAVAVGTTSRMEASVTNISFFDARVRLSTLNPQGPFECRAHLEHPYWKGGELELPPEHILMIPIHFQPTDTNQVVEMFEVISGPTVLHLQARGRGVQPSFAFQPDREVFMVTSAAGKKADLAVSISNTCEARLSFRISPVFLREGHSLPSPPVEVAPSAPTSPKQKKDNKKEKKAKGAPEFTALTEELETCLENEFVDVETPENTEPLFKVVNADENITVGCGETQQVILRFTPPVLKPEAGTSPDAEGSRKNSPTKEKKGKDKSIDTQDASTVDTKLGGKRKRSSSEKEEKKKETPSKKGEKKESLKGKGDKKNETAEAKDDKKKGDKSKVIYAAKFTVILAGTHKVKDWVVLGMKK